MGKLIPDAVLDAQLALCTDATMLSICSAEPADYAEATTTGAVCLAKVVITGADFEAAEANAPTGRKVQVKVHNGLTVDASGNATHIVLSKTVGTLLKHITTCTSQALTVGNLVNCPAYWLKNPAPV
jgi:hypothetical protein